MLIDYTINLKLVPMKKIITLLLFVFIFSNGFSQLALEGFEATSGPTTLPAWTLGTGNWSVFDNGVGTSNSWTINNTVVAPPLVYAGSNAAYINRENIGINQTSEDYLSTPLTTIPTNGQLRFWTRSFTLGNQGTLYKIKIAPATATVTNPAQYVTTLQTWTEDQLTAVYNVYEEKVLDLSAYAGQQIYVSFVMSFTQPTGVIGGDRWLVDNVRIVQKCLEPTNPTATAITATTASLTWGNPSGASSWEIEVVPAANTPTGIGTIYNGPLPYVVTGLTPNTSYKYYVKAVCSPTLSSLFVGPTNFTTGSAPAVCGGNFVDNGGTTGNYTDNADVTTTICPTISGQQVTVTFTNFNTEANWDGLYVFNGNSIAAPQIASANPAGNVPGGLAGSYWGTTIPGPFTGTSPNGCLTFRFRSDTSFNFPGWASNVTCAPPPTCLQPTTLTNTVLTSTTANLGWINPGTATSFQVLALACGTPAPTATTTGFITTTANPYLFTGLTGSTCYDFYVRAVCAPNDLSLWSGPRTVTTLVTPPACGGLFYDNGGPNANYTNSADVTTTICPTTAGQQVTVTFTSFDTETSWDGLYVFDGNNIAATQIASANPGGNVPGGAPGSFWGNTIPGPFTGSSPNGCLTFRFRSDTSVNFTGWVANVTCAPPPTCPKPTNLVVSGVTQNSATIAWTETGTATNWQVLLLPPTAAAPTATTTGWVTASTNPFTFNSLTSGTQFKVYVRSVCSATDISLWSNLGVIFSTLIVNNECINAVAVTDRKSVV